MTQAIIHFGIGHRLATRIAFTSGGRWTRRCALSIPFPYSKFLAIIDFEWTMTREKFESQIMGGFTGMIMNAV
jgi:hypothetical protein